MADPKEQTPVVRDDEGTRILKPGLEPNVRRLVIFLSISILALALAVWVMAFGQRMGGILAPIGGAFAFAALLHSLRKS